MPNTALNRSGVLILTNKSGSGVLQGDVVVLSKLYTRSFTVVSGSAYSDTPVGVVLDSGGIANDADGAVVLSGYAPKINLGVSCQPGQYVQTSGLKLGGALVNAGQGAFAVTTSSGTSPSAHLFGAPVFSASDASFSDVVGGRLTLTSQTPVTVSDVTSAGTLYYTAHKGGNLGLSYGGSWQVFSFTEVSKSLSAISSGTNYDVFAYWTGSVIDLELVAWTNNTTRATALSRSNGILVKSDDITRRYLGTIRGSGAGTTEDSAAKRFVWNAYNQVRRSLHKGPATETNWTYSSTTPRAANNDTTLRVEIVAGLQEADLDLTLGVVTSGNSAAARVWIAEDATSGEAVTDYEVGRYTLFGASLAGVGWHQLRKMPSIGYHYYQWMEVSESGGTITFYDNVTGTNRYVSGINGYIDG